MGSIMVSVIKLVMGLAMGSVLVSVIKTVMWFVMRSVMGSVSSCHEVYRTAHSSEIIKLPSLSELGQV